MVETQPLRHQKMREFFYSFPQEGIAIHGTSSLRYQKMLDSGFIDVKRSKIKRSYSNHYFVLYPDQDLSDIETVVHQIGVRMFDAATYALEAAQWDSTLDHIKSLPTLIVFVPPRVVRHVPGLKDPQHETIKTPTPKSRIIGSIELSDKNSGTAIREIFRIIRRYVSQDTTTSFAGSQQPPKA